MYGTILLLYFLLIITILRFSINSTEFIHVENIHLNFKLSG